jgi:hypothetical protein
VEAKVIRSARLRSLPRRMPWDMSIPKGDGNDVPNVPTPEGAEMGAEFARLADRAELQQREHFPDMLPRCNDCALRAGTGPNQCVATLMDVLKCVTEDRPFFCHKGVAEGDQPKRLCTGAMVLMSTIADGRKKDRRERNARKRERREARGR